MSEPSTAVQTLIRLALEEDLGTGGDITSRYFIPLAQEGKAILFAKEPCVLSGLEQGAEVFRQVDSTCETKLLRKDGDRIGQGDPILVVDGPVRSLLSAERTALNFMQRLSGIATLTRQYVDAIAGTSARLLDTRKTTPGWRSLEKKAVIDGGGHNHRIGLYDRVLVKDNHLAALAGSMLSLEDIIANIRREKPGIAIELEAATLDQVTTFASMEIDYLLLDNMKPEVLRQALAIVRGRIKTEASGGVNLQTIRTIAETGVDFISVGALTHSATAVDLSMDIEVRSV